MNEGESAMNDWIKTAIKARAHVAHVATLVAAAEAEYMAAFTKSTGAERTSLPSVIEVQWCDPKSEADAVLDLAVAKLGGRLTAARQALESAKREASNAQKEAMIAAAQAGRIEWREEYDLK